MLKRVALVFFFCIGCIGKVHGDPGCTGVLFRWLPTGFNKESWERFGKLPFPLTKKEYEVVAFVSEIIPESLAEDAGLMVNDILVHTNTSPDGIKTMEDIEAEEAKLENLEEGEVLKWRIRRKDKRTGRWSFKDVEFKAIKKELGEDLNKKAERMNAGLPVSGEPLIIKSISGLGGDRHGPGGFIKLENISKKVVDAVEVVIYCFNDFDEPVQGPLGESCAINIPCQEDIGPGCTGRFYAQLHQGTTYIEVWVKRLIFTDQEEWRQSRRDAVLNNTVRVFPDRLGN